MISSSDNRKNLPQPTRASQSPKRALQRLSTGKLMRAPSAVVSQTRRAAAPAWWARLGPRACAAAESGVAPPFDWGVWLICPGWKRGAHQARAVRLLLDEL